MISLVTLWGFAAQSTASKAVNQRNLDTTNEIYGNAAQPMLVTLAQERQESVVWLSRDGLLPRTSMDAVRKKMDGTIVQMNKAVRSGKFQATLNDPMKRRLSTLMEKLNRINDLRGQVDSRAMTRLAAFNAYNDVLEAHFRYVNVLVAGDGLQQAFHLANMSRATELLGREAALVGGVLSAGGRMTAAEYTAVTKLVFERRYLETSSLSELKRATGAPYQQALSSSAVKSFTAVEDGILATRPGARLQTNPAAWKAAAAASIGEMDGALGKSRVILADDAKQVSDETLLRLALIGATGLFAIVLTAFLMLRFGRRISRDLRGLQGTAHALAEERLPDVVRRLSRGDKVDVATEAPPLEVGRTAEVFNVAAAFSSVQRTAVEAAVGQAELRTAVNQVFQNLARRNQSLLHRQLAMLDTLERKASDPDALADLFAIDHLTTRMRRHAEGLIILSGAAPGRGWRHPVGVLDVLRGAIGEIEDYARVDVVSTAEEGIVGPAVADVIHLLAELIENATVLSPPNTPVEIDAGLVGQGFVVEIQDRGLGMGPDKLAAFNEQLSRKPEFDLTNGEQLGLFVVGTLAHRHGIKVALEPNSYGGIKTIVLLPHSIVVSADRTRGVADADTGSAGVPANAPTGTAPDGTAPPAGSDPRNITGRDEQEYAMDSVGRHRVGITEPRAGHDPLGMPPPPEPPPAKTSSTTAGTHAGMPRRVRRANLAPQLREAAPPAPEETQSSGRAERSPERARSVMASMQSGWRRGRSEPPPVPPAERNDEGER
ncbi:sensor histidine kinase [Spirillospora sp. CA-128828]|uniref:sensor histidine kinase n=1 Tax=Spirillospora sp. CA-128828 TaxID=3240033 RepID=UPI003D93354D